MDSYKDMTSMFRYKADEGVVSSAQLVLETARVTKSERSLLVAFSQPRPDKMELHGLVTAESKSLHAFKGSTKWHPLLAARAKAALAFK